MPILEIHVQGRKARVRFEPKLGPLTSYWVAIEVHEDHVFVGNPGEAETRGYALTYLEIASVIQIVLGRPITLKHKPISINRDAEPALFWKAYDFEKGNSC